MKKYKIIGNVTIIHNSKKFASGDIVEMEDNEAMRLRLYLEPVPDKKTKPSAQEKDKAESGDEPKVEQPKTEQSNAQHDIFNSKTKEQNKE